MENPNNAPALVPQGGFRRPAHTNRRIEPQTLDEMKSVAAALAQSGMFPDAREAAQAFAKMIAGQEYGIGAFASMTQIYIIEGKPTMSASLVAGVIKRSGIYNYKVVQTDEKAAVIDYYEGGEFTGRSEFSMTDAARANLTNKQNWQKYPKAMLFARAMTQGARAYCPDVFGGAIYTPEEIKNDVVMDSTGGAVTLENATTVQVALPPAPSEKPPTIKELRELYDRAREAKAVKDTLKLGEWMELDGHAPGLTTRVNPLTNKIEAPKPDELLSAKRALDQLLAAAPAQTIAPEFEVDPEEVPPPSEEPPKQYSPNDPLPGFNFDSTEPVEPRIGLSPSERVTFMTLFNERKNGIKAFLERDEVLAALLEMNVPLKTIDQRRHAFAITILGPDKGSSTTWTPFEAARVRKALESMPIDAP
jgi:hypothetical protein